MANIKTSMLLLLAISNLQTVLGQADCCSLSNTPETITDTSFPLAIAITADGSCIAIAEELGKQVLIYPQTSGCTYNTTPNVLPIGNIPRSVSFSPTGNCLAVAVPGNTEVLIYTPSSPCNYTLTTTLTGFTVIQQVLISPTGTCLAVVDSGAGTVSVYPFDSSCAITGSPTTISLTAPFRAAFSSDGSCLAIGDITERVVNIYPLVSGCTYSTTPSTQYTGITPSQVLFSHSDSCFIISSSHPSSVVSVFPQISGCTYSTTASTTITPDFPTILSVALSPNDSCLVITSAQSAATQSRFIDPQLAIYPLMSECSYSTSPTTDITLPGGTALLAFSPVTSCLAVAIQNGLLVYDSSSLTVSVNPSSITVVVNDTLTITSTVTGASGTVTYSWTGPNGFTATTPTITIPNITPDDAGTYTLTVTDNLGCQAVANSQVTVNPCASPLLVDINPSTITVRVGGTFTLTAEATGATPPYNYSWTGADGFTANTQAITLSNVTLVQGGTYMVTVTDSFGCQNSATAQVTVVPCTLAVSVIPPTITVAVSSTLVLFSSVTGGTSPFTYAWTGPIGFTANTPTITIPNIVPANAGTYTLTVTDNLGCQAIGSSDVTVNPCASPLLVTINPPVSQVPVGGTSQLTAEATGATPPYNYLWAGPDGFTATTQAITIPNITLAQGGIYMVTVTDSFGCQNTSTAQVTVFCNGPVASITPSITTVMIDSSLTLASLVSGGMPPYSYAWTGPKGFTANTPIVTIANVTLANAGTYTLTVTDALECQAVANAQVTVNPCASPLVVTINPPVAQVKVGEIAELTALATGATPPYTYQWTGPNGFTATTQTIPFSNSTTAQSGSYTVLVTDTFGCQNSTTAQIVVDPCAVISVSIIPSTTTVAVGTSVTLAASVSGGTSPFTYIWTGPNGFSANTPTITIPHISIAQAGSYTVTVTDSAGCQNTSTSIINVMPFANSILSQAIRAKYC